MHPPLVYIAGPYTGAGTHSADSYFTIHANIARVHEMGLRLARLGYHFFAPHVHSAHNEVIAPDIPARYWYALDLRLLRACDAMIVLPGESAGVTMERAHATQWGIPVFETLEALTIGIPLEIHVNNHLREEQQL